MTTLHACLPTLFAAQVAYHRERNARIAANVDHRTYSRADRTFLSADGQSGFAVIGGTLASVFSTRKGRGDVIVAAAVAAGAVRLECFEGHLSTLYARHGFVITGRVANWTPGEPDVVTMTLAVSAPTGDDAANRASWSLAESATR